LQSFRFLGPPYKKVLFAGKVDDFFGGVQVYAGVIVGTIGEKKGKERGKNRQVREKKEVRGKKSSSLVVLVEMLTKLPLKNRQHFRGG
jgi:hypothetical protein